MVEITEDDTRIYIKMLNRGNTNLETVYNNNYFFSLGIEVVDEKTKNDNENADVLENFTEGAKIIFIIEKTLKESSLISFASYLDELKKNPLQNPLTVFFESGIDYVVLENITNDVCSCLDYIKLNGMQLIEKKKEQIYVINGRFIVLTEDVTLFDEKNIPNEESILKLLSEICGINYVRGEDHFKSFIYGTFLYNKLKKLISE
jgi:hypothetical protein